MSDQNQLNHASSPESPRTHDVDTSPPSSPMNTGKKVPANQTTDVTQLPNGATTERTVQDVLQQPGDKISSEKNFDCGMFFLGLLLSFLFSFFSLIGLCVIKDSVRKKSYGIGWSVGFVPGVILSTGLYINGFNSDTYQ